MKKQNTDNQGNPIDSNGKLITEQVNSIADITDDDFNNELNSIFNKAINGEIKGKSIPIGRLTQEGRDYLKSMSGVEFKDDVSFVVNPSDLVHIYNEHFGENEKDLDRNIPLDEDDIKNIIDVITQPTNVVYLGESSGQKFAFLKNSTNGTYNLLEVYTTKRGNLGLKTFYKTKKDASHRDMILLKESQNSTPEANGAILSNANIPILFENPNNHISNTIPSITHYRNSNEIERDYPNTPEQRAFNDVQQKSRDIALEGTKYCKNLENLALNFSKTT